MIADDEILQRAFAAALAAREHSYSPYSAFKVGAAIVTRSGRIIGGCNVENASYGGTVCAERIAVFRAIAESGEREFVAIVIVADVEPTVVPCALCLQVLAEFCGPELVIGLGDLAGIRERTRLGDLLPRAFGPGSLPPQG